LAGLITPLSQKTAPVAPLSQWLQLMLAEIARKREELERADAEAARRSAESSFCAGGTTAAEEMPT
jgi:hypothetical protein